MDLYFSRLVNQLALKWKWLDIFGIFCAKYLGHLVVLFLLLFLVINFKKYWLMVVEAAVAGIVARLFFVEIIHFILPRNRPFLDNNVSLLLKNVGHIHYSFPSGHASFFFAVSTIVFLFLRKIYIKENKFFLYLIGIFFLISAFLISLARVFVGVHWPSDVVVGAIIGIFSAWLVFKFLLKG